MPIPKDLRKYLEDYTTDFVNKLISKLYSDPETSSLIKQAVGAIGGVVGGVAAFPIGLADAGISIGREFATKLYDKVSTTSYKHTVTNGIKNILYTAGDSEISFRKEVIYAGLQIFISFRHQFHTIPVQNDLNRERIVTDIVSRVFTFIVQEIRNNSLKNIASLDICKGVLLGSSKPRSVLKFKGGSDILAKSGETFRTLDLFEKCGFVYDGDVYDSNAYQKSLKSVGNRLLFEWELDRFTKSDTNDGNISKYSSWKFWQLELDSLTEQVFNDTNNLLGKVDNYRQILEQIITQIENLKIADSSAQQEILKTVKEIASRESLPGQDQLQQIQDIGTNNNDFLLILKSLHASTVSKLEEINNKLDNSPGPKLPNKGWLTPLRPKEFEIANICKRTQNGVIVIDEIAHLFEKYSRVAITGGGGYGKTTTALWYVHNFRHEYKYLVWIDCESEFSMEKCFESVAVKLGIHLEFRPNSPKPLTHFLDEIYQILELEKCLFIYDNVEFPLNSYLSPKPNHYTIMTSREVRRHDQVGLVQLTVFTPKEAVHFMCKGLEIPENDEVSRQLASDLATKLGYLPLALKLVTIKVPNVRDHLLKHLKEIEHSTTYSNFNLLQRELPDYPKSLCSTLEVSLKTLESSEKTIGTQLLKTTITILYLMCFFESGKIHSGIFSPLEENLVFQALELAKKYSLIEDGPVINGTQFYTFHRLWQIVLKNRLKLKNSEQVSIEVIRLCTEIYKSYEFRQVGQLLSLWHFVIESEVLLVEFHDFSYFVATELLKPIAQSSLTHTHGLNVELGAYDFCQEALTIIPTQFGMLTICKLRTLMVGTKPYYVDAQRLSEEIAHSIKSLGLGKWYLIRAEYNRAMVLGNDLAEPVRKSSILFMSRHFWVKNQGSHLQDVAHAVKILNRIYKEIVNNEEFVWPQEIDFRVHFPFSIGRKTLKLLHLLPDSISIIDFLAALLFLTLTNGKIQKCFKILDKLKQKPGISPAVLCQIEIFRAFVLLEGPLIIKNSVGEAPGDNSSNLIKAAHQFDKAFEEINNNLDLIDVNNTHSLNSLLCWLKKYLKLIGKESEGYARLAWNVKGEKHFAEIERVSYNICKFLQTLPVPGRHCENLKSAQRSVIQNLLREKRYSKAYSILSEIIFREPEQTSVGTHSTINSSIFLQQYILESLLSSTHSFEVWRVNQELLKHAFAVANGIVKSLQNGNCSAGLIRNARLNLARVLTAMKRVDECYAILEEIQMDIVDSVDKPVGPRAEVLKHLSNGLLRLEDGTPDSVLLYVIKFIRQN